MKIGIAIDPWKLQIFQRYLDESGYSYETTVGELFTVITVEAKYAHELQPIVEAANKEARKERES